VWETCTGGRPNPGLHHDPWMVNVIPGLVGAGVPDVQTGRWTGLGWDGGHGASRKPGLCGTRSILHRRTLVGYRLSAKDKTTDQRHLRLLHHGS